MKTPYQSIALGLRNPEMYHELQLATLEKTHAAGEFLIFEQQINGLDAELRTLSNEARQLGSSVGILSASSRLRERLANILILFRRNAIDLYSEQGVSRPAHPTVKPKKVRDNEFNEKSAEPQVAKHKEPLKSDPEHISSELHMFSRDITTLLECFIQFPEFVDEIPDRSLGDDLKYWATSLDELKDDFGTHAVQRFLYDSMADIGERLDHLAKEFIPVFINIGIPTVRSSQKHSASVLENLSTIATLFSGVTATMLQFSWTPSQGTTLFAAVNLFWFTSLVFSISAAVNSLLGLTWTQAFFRSPDHRVPWWVRIWITKSPLAFLVLSVACFFVGLIAFVYASNQAKITSTFTAVLSTMSCFGLAAMSFWFALEFWIYNRHDGRKWLADVITSEWNHFKRHPLVRKGLNQPREIWVQGKRVGRFLTQTAPDDPEMLQEPARPIGSHRRHQSVAREVLESSTVSFWLSVDKAAMKSNEIARYRWHEAVRRILDSHHVQHNSPRGRPNLTSAIRFAHLHNLVPSVRSSDMIQKLQQMEVTQKVVDDDTVSEGLVKFLEFSPDGKLLVTSSWNGRSFVSEVANNLLRQRTFAHPINLGFIKQIEWSPEGDMVLMRSNRSITVFKKEDGNVVYKHEQDGPPIRSVAWLQSEHDHQEVISIEGEKVVKLSAAGEEVKLQFREPRIDKFKIREVVITKDSRWMICIGKSQGTEREDGKVATLNKDKHEIILYNLQNLTIMKRHRVYHGMCSISLTFDNNYALISYENKAPPQLWRLQGRWGKDAQLCLEHTYMPREPTHFAALPSSLGGFKDEFVLRASAAGDMFFWHTYTGRMLYRLRAPPTLGHLTSFAWNRKAETWMLATGTHEGVVYIWTIPTYERPALSFSTSTPDLKRHFTTSQGTLVSLSTPQRRSYTTSTYGFNDRSTDSPISRTMFVLPEDRPTRTLVDEPESNEQYMRRTGSSSEGSSS